jgi:hypothetical protein
VTYSPWKNFLSKLLSGAEVVGGISGPKATLEGGAAQQRSVDQKPFFLLWRPSDELPSDKLTRQVRSVG